MVEHPPTDLGGTPRDMVSAFSSLFVYNTLTFGALMVFFDRSYA